MQRYVDWLGYLKEGSNPVIQHYAFNHWMKRNHSKNPWCCYADDGLVHCRTQSEAEQMLVEIGERFNFCGLELHPDKPRSFIAC